MRRLGAMLDGKRELVVGAPEVEARVKLGVEFRGAAECLTGTGVARTLARVMHDDDGDREAALEVAQVGEQWRDLGADVLVDAMQSHERVEDEQRGSGPSTSSVSASRCWSSRVSMRKVGAVRLSRCGGPG